MVLNSSQAVNTDNALFCKPNFKVALKCIVCGNEVLRAPKGRRHEATPHQSYSKTLLDFLKMDADFLQKEGVYVHTYCNQPAVYRSKLAPKGELTKSVANLQYKFNFKEPLQALDKQFSKTLYNIAEPFEDGKAIEEGAATLESLKVDSFMFIFQQSLDNMNTYQKAAYLEQAKYVQYRLLSQFRSEGLFTYGGDITISKSSTSKTGITLQHRPKPAAAKLDKSLNLSKRALADRRKKSNNFAIALGTFPPNSTPTEVAVATSDNKTEMCYACQQRPLKRAKPEEEASFYLQHQISYKKQLAFKRFCRAHNADIFQPTHAIQNYLKKLEEIEFEHGTVQLYQGKNEHEGNSELKSFPYLQVADFNKSVTQHILQLDKSGKYRSFEYHKSDERTLLYEGDLGAQATTNGFADTHMENANGGQEFRIWHHYERAADSYVNLKTVLQDKIGPGIEKLQDSSVIRMRSGFSSNEKLCCAAVVPSPAASLLPTMFMASPIHSIGEEDIFLTNDFTPKGRNIAHFILANPSPLDVERYCAYSVVTVNLGGPQMDMKLWSHVASFLKVKSLCLLAGKASCNCKSSPESVRELEMQYVPFSANFFGSLKFAFEAETILIGDEIEVLKLSPHLFYTGQPIKNILDYEKAERQLLFNSGCYAPHAHFCGNPIEITSQTFKVILSSDYAFTHSLCGFEGNFRHGKYKCEECEIHTSQLARPWEELNPKPPLRTAESIARCLRVFTDTKNSEASKGVVAPEIIKFKRANIAPHFVHTQMGVFQKCFDGPLNKFQKQIDIPLLTRDEKGLKCSTLQQQIQKEVAKLQSTLATKKKELNEMTETLSLLEAYCKKLGIKSKASNKFPKLMQSLKHTAATKKIISKEITTSNTNLKLCKKKLESAVDDLKRRRGPVETCLETALGKIGIQRTIYFGGKFVGPHLSRLMDDDSFMFVLHELSALLSSLPLTNKERLEAEVIFEKTKVLWTAFFRYHKLLKVMSLFGNDQLAKLQDAISQFSKIYRDFFPGVVTPKFHFLEAHVVDFVREHRCSWPYAEEAVESAHHWIKSLKLANSHMIGKKKQLQAFILAWQRMQNPRSKNLCSNVMERGRLRKRHARPLRTKFSFDKKVCEY